MTEQLYEAQTFEGASEDDLNLEVKEKFTPVVKTPGVYAAGIAEIKTINSKNPYQDNKEQKRLMVNFEIKSTGERIARFYNPYLSAGSKLMSLVNLFGSTPATGAKFDLRGLIGKECQIVLENAKKADGRTYSKIVAVTK